MDFSKHTTYITVKDHSVSGETFELLMDDTLQLLKTHPQPSSENLGRYYESDDYISHTDGKRSMFEQLYHAVKQKALSDKIKMVTQYAPSKGRLLDIGAGTGDFLAVSKIAGWEATGFEPSDKARAIAEKKGITFTESTNVLPDHSFDAITMWHVLEHVSDVQAQITELKRLLKPDGVLVVAVPNFNSYDAKHYGPFWAAYDVPRHLWHFSQTAVKKLFGAGGMEVVKVLPMKFDSFYVSLLSEKYKTGKMDFIRGFWTGLRSNLKAASTSEYSSLIYIIKSPKNTNKAI